MEHMIELKKRAVRTISMFVMVKLLLSGPVDTCDYVVTMDGGNITMFCKGSACEFSLKPSFRVQRGQEICVEDHFGERISLQVSEIVWQNRFELAYYTSNYTIKMYAADSCCSGASSRYCERRDNSAPCYLRALEKLKEEKFKRGHDSKAYMHSCIAYNGHERISCSSYLQPEKSGDLISVLRKTSAVGRVVFTLKETSQKVTLTSYDSTHALPSNLKGIGDIQVTVLDTTSFLPRSLLHYKNEFYYVNSSEIGEPSYGIFGDYQVALRNESAVIFAVPSGDMGVSCRRVDACNCSCKSSSTVPRWVSTVNTTFSDPTPNLKRAENFIVREADKSIVDVFDTDGTGEVQLRLGAWDAGDFHSMNGRCQVELLGSYGCRKCNESAYVVLRASNITRRGLVPFRSNCSFHRDAINCDYEPTRLILRERATSCYIRMPTLYKRMTVGVTFYEYGHRLEPRVHSNCTDFGTFGEAVANLVTSGTFVGTAFGAAVIFIVLSFMLMLFYDRRRKHQLGHTDIQQVDPFEL